MSEVAAECPSITLAGTRYPIPEIPFRVAKVIMPKILGRPNVSTIEGLDDVLFIIQKAIAAGTESPPSVAELEDKHLPLPELLAAFAVVSAQSGLKRSESPGEAAGATSPQTSKS